LTELWLSTPAGNPIVLAYPTTASSEDVPWLGANVHFDGTFLKPIRYEDGKLERLAPLVVGPRAPVIVGVESSTRASPRPTWTIGEWALGIGLAALVVAALIVQRLRQPPRRRTANLGPPVEFQDGNPNDSPGPALEDS
jgi:hypothetical protein